MSDSQITTSRGKILHKNGHYGNVSGPMHGVLQFDIESYLLHVENINYKCKIYRPGEFDPFPFDDILVIPIQVDSIIIDENIIYKFSKHNVFGEQRFIRLSNIKLWTSVPHDLWFARGELADLVFKFPPDLLPEDPHAIREYYKF